MAELVAVLRPKQWPRRGLGGRHETLGGKNRSFESRVRVQDTSNLLWDKEGVVVSVGKFRS